MSDKDRVQTVIDSLPDDATYDDIIRELVFLRMIDRGLTDVCNGRSLSNEEMGRRIAAWRR